MYHMQIYGSTIVAIKSALVTKMTSPRLHSAFVFFVVAVVVVVAYAALVVLLLLL